MAGPWACHVDVGDNDSAAGAQAAEYLVRDFAEKTELVSSLSVSRQYLALLLWARVPLAHEAAIAAAPQQATILRIAGPGQSNECSAAEAIRAPHTHTLPSQPLPPYS